MKIYLSEKRQTVVVVPEKGIGTSMPIHLARRGFKYICETSGSYDSVTAQRGRKVIIVDDYNTIKYIMGLKMTDEHRIKELERDLEKIKNKLSS